MNSLENLPTTRCLSARKRRHLTTHAPQTQALAAQAATTPEPDPRSPTSHPRGSTEKGKVDRRPANGNAGYRFS